MNNLGLLLKTNIINEYGINKIKNTNSKEKNKMIGMTLLITIGIVAMAYYIFKVCFLVADMLIQINQMELLLVIGFLMGTVFTLFTSLYKASSYLFQAKDFDMLTSLPIKESTILTSKVLMLVFTNYIFSLGFMIIPAIVYFIKVDTSITFLPYLAILFLLMPFIPIVISSLISLFIGNISSRVKYKNIVLIMGSIILVLAYMAIITQIENIAQELLKNSASIIDGVNKLYPLTYYFVDALKNNNFISLIIFSIASLTPFIVFVILFSKGFKNINSKMNESYKAKNYEFKELKTLKPIEALLIKEIRRYLSSYIYVLNTSFGMILLLISTLGVVVFGAEKIDAILQLNLDMSMLKPQIVIMLLFIIVLTCTTYCSISLEGKNLWILKSSPIEETDIFKAKILLNIILNMPISIISFLILGFKLEFDIAFILIMSATIVAMSLLVAVSGIYANLLFPNLDWKNEVAVVKRSASFMVVLFGLFIYIGVFVLIYNFMNIADLNIYLIIATVITFIIDILLWNIIKTKGVKIFRAL